MTEYKIKLVTQQQSDHGINTHGISLASTPSIIARSVDVPSATVYQDQVAENVYQSAGRV